MPKKRKPEAEMPSVKGPTLSKTSPIRKAFWSRNQHFIAIGLMLAVALVAYANTFHVPFQFDDRPNILENPYLQIKSFGVDQMEHWIKNIYPKTIRTFAFFTFALNYYFGKFNVFGYHLVNFLIHISSGIFLYGFLLLTFNLPSLKKRYGSIAFPVALFSSLLFIGHPIQTQSVTYIVQRMASMAGMFYLLSMLLYVKGRTSQKSNPLLYFAGAALSYFLAFSSKENAIILPLFIGLYELFFFQNLDLKNKGKKFLIYLACFVALMGFLGFLYLGKRAQGYQILSLYKVFYDLLVNAYRGGSVTLTQNLLTQFRVVLYYVTLLIYPHPSRLNLDCDFPVSRGIFDPPTTLFSILIVLGLMGYSFWIAKKKPLISFFILWYFGNLVIESSIFPLDLVFEHRLYLPAIGPIVLFTLLVVRGWEKIKGIEHRRQKAEGSKQEAEGKRQEAEGRRQEAESSLRQDLPLWIAFLSISFLFSLGACQRNTVWKNEITLWEDTVRKSPNKPRARSNLGYSLVMDKQFERGVEELNLALKLDPKFRAARYNLGLAYGEMKLFDKALFHLEEYLRLVPGDPEAYNEIGVIHLQKKKYDEAILFFNKGLKINPNLAKIRSNLGDAYLQSGMLDEAILEYKEALHFDLNLTSLHVKLAEAYEKKGLPDLALEEIKNALQMDPSLNEAHTLMGASYIQKGRIDEGISELKEALKFDTKDANIYNNLGVAYRRKNLLDEAMANYKKALEIDPSFSEVRTNLGEIYFEKGMVNEAISEFRHVIEIDPRRAEAYNNLGVIFLRTKRLEEAISSFKKALTINPKYGDAYFNLAVAHYYRKDIRSSSLCAQKALDLGYEVDPRLLRALGIR